MRYKNNLYNLISLFLNYLRNYNHFMLSNHLFNILCFIIIFIDIIDLGRRGYFSILVKINKKCPEEL